MHSLTPFPNSWVSHAPWSILEETATFELPASSYIRVSFSLFFFFLLDLIKYWVKCHSHPSCAFEGGIRGCTIILFAETRKSQYLMCHEGFIKNISCRRNKYEETSLSLWVDSVSIFADFNLFNYVERTERAEGMSRLWMKTLCQDKFQTPELSQGPWRKWRS